jgi:hypothetical protein
MVCTEFTHGLHILSWFHCLYKCDFIGVPHGIPIGIPNATYISCVLFAALKQEGPARGKDGGVQSVLALSKADVPA